MFNPWVLLGMIVSILGAFGSGYYKGENDESARNQIEVARLNEQARANEQRMVEQNSSSYQQLQKINKDADQKQAQLRSDLASANLRLFIHTKSGLSMPSDASYADSEKGTQLDQSTSNFLISLTTTGDKAINELNSCIDQYNNVYKIMKGNQ
jgi:hypothetical protein